MYHEFNLEKEEKQLLILHATQQEDVSPYVALQCSSKLQYRFDFNQPQKIETWNMASYITLKDLH